MPTQNEGEEQARRSSGLLPGEAPTGSDHVEDAPRAASDELSTAPVSVPVKHSDPDPPTHENTDGKPVYEDRLLAVHSWPSSVEICTAPGSPDGSPSAPARHSTLGGLLTSLSGKQETPPISASICPIPVGEKLVHLGSVSEGFMVEALTESSLFSPNARQNPVVGQERLTTV
jgi:hypothetical protein